MDVVGSKWVQMCPKKCKLSQVGTNGHNTSKQVQSRQNRSKQVQTGQKGPNMVVTIV